MLKAVDGGRDEFLCEGSFIQIPPTVPCSLYGLELCDCLCAFVTLLPSRLQTLEHKNKRFPVNLPILLMYVLFLSLSLSLFLVQRPATQDLGEKELASPPKKPKTARMKPSPSGRRKKVAARSKSPKKSPLQEKVEVLANGEVSTDTSPAKKPTARKRRSPGGKRVGKSKPKSSARRRQPTGDDEPDCNSAELQIPQVAYPPELGYGDPECLEESSPPGKSKALKRQPRKMALVSLPFFKSSILPCLSCLPRMCMLFVLLGAQVQGRGYHRLTVKSRARVIHWHKF